ncbi:SPBc2 prophage-derived aminoglycoside N(3')-acetyltransferase-like protein YokD [Colletotrichum tropicale]|nr:SPBc2 prophage-derived aminoglycoside N(3')-acetyltransferase-like protein YokD [Colletotrichum tropicale]
MLAEIIGRPLCTKRSLILDFKKLGIVEGETLLLHSSLSRLGWVNGGAETVISALLEVLGDEGTLVVPTYTGDNTDPAEWRSPRAPRELWQTIRDTMPAYDPRITRTRGVGAIPEMLRNWPGAMRSAHPQTSFAAVGPKADEITAGHALDCRLGENSPLAKLEQLEARILLLGTAFDTCTAFHLAEYRNVAPLESNSFAAIVDGSRQWVTVRDITLNDDDFGFIAVTGPQFEAELQITLEKQHNTPFEHGATPQPFWRLEVLDDRTNSGSFVACLCFHHSLMDTKSALIFHEGLEKALNHSSRTTHSQDALLPSLEAVYDLPVSEAFVQQALNYIESPGNVWSGAVQKLPVRTRVRLFWVPGEVADSFRKHCKGQRASVTAGIMALLAAAFFKVLPDDYDTLQGDCAVSLRHLLPDPINDRSLGCYVGSFSEQYSRGADPALVWSDARRTKATIDEVAQRRGADMPVGYLRHVADDMSGWLSRKLGKKRVAAWELSNVGVVGYAGKVTETEFRMERMLFSQSASATSGAVKVSVVTGRDGQLGFAFSWQEGIVEGRLAEEVVSTFRELLLALASEGSR